MPSKRVKESEIIIRAWASTLREIERHHKQNFNSQQGKQDFFGFHNLN